MMIERMQIEVERRVETMLHKLIQMLKIALKNNISRATPDLESEPKSGCSLQKSSS